MNQNENFYYYWAEISFEKMIVYQKIFYNKNERNKYVLKGFKDRLEIFFALSTSSNRKKLNRIQVSENNKLCCTSIYFLPDFDRRCFATTPSGSVVTGNFLILNCLSLHDLIYALSSLTFFNLNLSKEVTHFIESNKGK